MKFKAILFDAYGVTIHSPMMFSEKLERDYDIPKGKMVPFFKDPFQKCLIGKADLKEELAKVINDWGWKGSVDDMLNAWFDFENVPDTKMLGYIQELRKQGVKCYLATNQEKYRAQYLREMMNFQNLFDGLFISAEIGYKKKDPTFFKIILESLTETNGEIQPHDIFFTDDENDNVTTAQTLGIDARVFTSMDELKKWIEN